MFRYFKNHSLIPWKLRNRWNNCLHIVRGMNFLVTHVFREGNCCADALANIGLTLDHLTIWLDLPDCVRGFYTQNRLGLPCFRNNSTGICGAMVARLTPDQKVACSIHVRFQKSEGTVMVKSGNTWKNEDGRFFSKLKMES
ncbi:hypothetical protein MTR_8g479410 [Medicago truncatula]|uniref:RNase H type-1 domain-containing protein n=1 Tax=Medicago truncatula TaxID=3880 RepID=A0A072TTJ8_MEDTR|nr:hypothetical protein MTR_8g479410 [Medicago truncatula]